VSETDRPYLLLGPVGRDGMVGRVVRKAVECPKRTTLLVLYALVVVLCAFGLVVGP
jgi:hypothetical protein